jgi:hypothetical protein
MYSLLKLCTWVVAKSHVNVTFRLALLSENVDIFRLRRSLFSSSINTSSPALLIHFCLILQLFMSFNHHLQIVNRPSWNLQLESQAAFLA